MTLTQKKALYGTIAGVALVAFVAVAWRARTDASFLRPAADAPALSAEQVGLPSELGTPAPGSAPAVGTAPAPAKNAAPSPFELSIPSIGVNAPVESVGQTVTGDMATPERLADVGWYEYGTAPGDAGSAVFAGHVDDALGLPAVFAKLDKVQVGDAMYVTTAAGTKLHFVVTDTELYDSKTAPVQEIFNDTSGAHLIRLITCSGTVENGSLSYDKRLVVTAKEV